MNGIVNHLIIEFTALADQGWCPPTADAFDSYVRARSVVDDIVEDIFTDDGGTSPDPLLQRALSRRHRIR